MNSDEGDRIMKYRFISDSHIHSENSFDGNDSVMMLCEQAVSLGLYSITITDHCECNEYFKGNIHDSIQNSILNIAKARAYYSGKINIYSGIELGQATQDPSAAQDALSLCDYDFVLGSLHNLKGMRDFYFLEYTEKNITSLLDCYFTELYELVTDDQFDSLAHITYPLRYIAESSIQGFKLDLWQKQIDAVLSLLVKNDKALEINTSGLRQKIGKTLPDAAVLNRFRELGGRYITIGSDAHRWGDIASGIEDGLKLALECGFTHFTVFSQRKPRLLPIE